MVENLSDADLVQRICQGCEESLLHLVVDRCGALIHTIALSFQFEGDLSHEVCVHLFGSGNWSRLRSWQGKSPLGAWIRSVASRICLNQYRAKMKYQRRFERLYDEGVPERGTESNQGELLLQQEENKSRLLQAITKLNERDQTVILLHCLGDLSIEALAEKLQLTVPAARVIKTRAMERLGDRLREEGAEDV